MKFYSFHPGDRVELRDRSWTGTVLRTVTTRWGCQSVTVDWDASPDGKARPRVVCLGYDLVPALELPMRVLA